MKEVTYEDWQKNPTVRMMWVWNSKVEDKVERIVLFLTERNPSHPVVVLTSDNITTANYKHCAEIEEPKTRRMTNKELSWWLSEKPHRELKMSNYIYHDYDYKENEQDAEVTDFLLIREDDGEWREPLIEETE